MEYRNAYVRLCHEPRHRGPVSSVLRRLRDGDLIVEADTLLADELAPIFIALDGDKYLRSVHVSVGAQAPTARNTQQNTAGTSAAAAAAAAAGGGSPAATAAAAIRRSWSGAQQQQGVAVGGAAGATAAAPALLSSPPALHDFDMSARLVRSLHSTLCVSAAIQSVELIGLRFSINGLRLLGKGIMRSNSLRRLSTRACLFGDQGLGALLPSLMRSRALVDVDFSLCALGDASGTALASWLGVAAVPSVLRPGLQIVELAQNNLTTESALALASVLVTPAETTLCILQLASNLIDENGVQALLDAAAKLPADFMLDVSDNPGSDNHSTAGSSDLPVLRVPSSSGGDASSIVTDSGDVPTRPRGSSSDPGDSDSLLARSGVSPEPDSLRTLTSLAATSLPTTVARRSGATAPLPTAAAQRDGSASVALLSSGAAVGASVSSVGSSMLAPVPSVDIDLRTVRAPLPLSAIQQQQQQQQQQQPQHHVHPPQGSPSQSPGRPQVDRTGDAGSPSTLSPAGTAAATLVSPRAASQSQRGAADLASMLRLSLGSRVRSSSNAGSSVAASSVMAGSVISRRSQSVSSPRLLASPRTADRTMSPRDAARSSYHQTTTGGELLLRNVRQNVAVSAPLQASPYIDDFMRGVLAEIAELKRVHQRILQAQAENLHGSGAWIGHDYATQGMQHKYEMLIDGLLERIRQDGGEKMQLQRQVAELRRENAALRQRFQQLLGDSAFAAAGGV